MLTRRLSWTWRMALVLVVCYLWVIPRGVLWNPDSRLALTYALVDTQQLTIDRFAQGLGDRAAVGGHFYTDKEPSLSLIAIPAYALFRLLIPPAAPGSYLVRWWLTFLVVGIPTIAAALVLGCALGARAGKPEAVAATLAFSLGAPTWIYATRFFSHQFAGDLLLLGLLAARRGWWRRTCALLALAVVSELPTAVLAGPILVAAWLIFRDRNRGVPAAASPWRALLDAAVVAVLIATPTAIVNTVSFGAPWHLGYQFLAGSRVFQVGMRQGFFGILPPNPDHLLALLLGPSRGLLWAYPPLVLLPWALRERWKGAKSERVLVIAAVVGFLCLLALISGYLFWDGGAAYGPRHLVPAVGLLTWLLAPAFRKRGTWVLIVLGGASAALALLTVPLIDPISAGGPTVPLVQVWLPRFVHGQLDNNLGMLSSLPGLASLFPLLAVVLLLRPWQGDPA